MNTRADDTPVAEQIDAIIRQHSGWKGEVVSRIRKAIHQADRDVVEEIKWRMATRPEGLPVWSHGGILCFVEIWKDNVKLLFPKGARFKDSQSLFNARLKSKDIRAIEFREGDSVDADGVAELVVQAIELNA